MAINYAAFAGLTPQQVYAQFANGLPVGWDWNAWQAAQPAGTPDYTATPDNSAFGGVDPWSQQFFEDTKVPLGNVPPPVTVTTGTGTPGSAPGGGQFDRNAFNAVINGAMGTRQRQPSMIFTPNTDYVRTTSGAGYVDTTSPTPPTGGSSGGSYVQTKPAQEIPTKNPTGATTAYEQPLPASEQGDGFSPFKSAPSSMQNPGAPSSAFPINIAGGTNPVIPQPVFRKAPEGGNPIVNAMVRRRRSPWDSY